jgi:hypothetical protein
MEVLSTLIGVGLIVYIAYLIGVDVGSNRQRRIWYLMEQTDKEKDPERRKIMMSELHDLFDKERRRIGQTEL